MSQTQAVYIDDTPYAGFQLNNRPLSALTNELEWMLRINVSTPATATLQVGLKHQGVHLNTIEGAASGWMDFTATIKAPELIEAQGNGQSGAADAWLPIEPEVQLRAQNGPSIHDYTVYFEVVEGGGSVGADGQSQTTVSTDGLGLARVPWKLGPSGNQRMRAYVDPSGAAVLAEYEFTAEIGDDSPCGGLSFMIDNSGSGVPIVAIGNQCWTSIDLMSEHYANGDLIPAIYDSEQWAMLTNGAMQNDHYNGYAVMDPRNVCPAGWHVPTFEDLVTIENHLGVEVAGVKMKSVLGWPIAGGTNESGFNGEPFYFIAPDGTQTSDLCSGTGGGLSDCSGNWWCSTTPSPET